MTGFSSPHILSSEMVNGIRVEYEVTPKGYFYARDPDGEVLHSGPNLLDVQFRVRKTLRAATRNRVAVPYMTSDFHPAVAKGKHATNGAILVWIDNGTPNGVNTKIQPYNSRQVLKPDLTEKQIQRLKALFEARARVNDLIHKWEAQHTFNLNEAVTQALRELQESE